MGSIERNSIIDFTGDRRGASLIAQSVKNLPAMQETWVQIPGSGRSSGEGNGNPLQYSCLGNHMDRGPWQATVCGVPRVGHNLASKPHVQRSKKPEIYMVKIDKG